MLPEGGRWRVDAGRMAIDLEPGTDQANITADARCIFKAADHAAFGHLRMG